MSKKFTITFGRECGAGATNIAELLSKDLKIPYYDKDIFRMVSDKSGVLEEFFHVNNERPGNNLLYKIIKDLNPKDQKPSLGKDIVSPDNLFRFQSELIRELAENETCMIIGRCADYILKDCDHVVKIFVCGDPDTALFARARHLQGYHGPIRVSPWGWGARRLAALVFRPAVWVIGCWGWPSRRRSGWRGSSLLFFVGGVLGGWLG